MTMNSDYRELFPSLEYLGSATRYVDEIAHIIDQAPLFDDLKLSEVEALCGFMHCFGAPRDENLMIEGTPGDFLLIILTGAVQVSRKGGNSAATAISIVGPGASLGEMSMIDGEPRFASCITVEPTDFAVLSRHDLNEIMVRMPHLGSMFLLLLLKVMTKRLREASNRLLPLIAGPAV